MTDNGFWMLNSVSDAQLQSALRSLLAHGSRTEARIVAHLAELEERRLTSHANPRGDIAVIFASCAPRTIACWRSKNSARATLRSG